MRDRDIAAAIVAGDPAGLATAYDTYGASLHAYCRTLLAEPADAADAVQDTFVIAAVKLGGLRDWDRFRPWLYAVARNECYRRLRGRVRPAGLDEAAEMTDTSADVGAQAERGELQGLVLAAIGGLNPGDREVIELNLRHDLDGADLADALGVPANQAHALASRARGQLERSLGALLVARTGRRQCGELDAILGDWDGRLTVLLRKRVSRHIEDCETCGARKRRELSPAMLLSVLPVVTLPAGLRHQVLRLVADSGPEAVGYRNDVAARAEPFAESGFPVQVTPASTARRSWRGVGRDGGGLGGGGSGDGGAGASDSGLGRRWSRRVLLGGAVALVVLLGVADAAYLLLSNTGHAAAAMHLADPTSPVVTTVPSSPAGGPARARSAPRSSRTATASPPASSSPVTPSSPAAKSSPSPSRSRSSPPPKRSPSPSPSPQPDPGTLAESPAVVVLMQSATGGSSTGAFTLTAAGGPVSFAIAVPASESYLTVSPASGKLSAGQSQQVSVTLTPNPTGPAPAATNTLTVNPGGITVTVQYSAAG